MAPDSLELEDLTVPPAGTRKNLVVNSGFEIDRDNNGLPDSWVIPGGFAAWDADTRLGFGHSLRLMNTTAGLSTSIYQTIPCQPYREYTFVAWVRGENVSAPADGVGAGLYVEFVTADGSYTRKEYLNGHKGTFEWSPVGGKLTAPSWAFSMRVGLHLGEGQTGTAWFDEVVVVGLMQVFITQPAYRRTVIAPARDPWVAEVNRTRMINWRTRKAYLRSKVFDAQGNAVMQGEVVFLGDGRPSEAEKRLTLQPPAGLPPGDYRWRFTLWNGYDNKKLDEVEYGVRVVGAGETPEVYIDSERRTIVGGEPFFPLGFYIAEEPLKEDGTPNPELLNTHLKHIADSGFNTVISYTFGAWGWSPQTSTGTHPTDFMNSVKANNLRAVYNLADFYEGTSGFAKSFPGTTQSDLELAADYIDLVRGHEAMLGWYLTDEPPASLTQKVQDLYQLVRELDPDHPCYQVHMLHPTSTQANVAHLSTFYDSTDVMGVDPYPVPNQPLTMVSNWTQDARSAVRGAKPVWTVIGIGDGSIYNGNPCDAPQPLPMCNREPTLAEKRCSAYLALIQGAQGLIFYSYFDIFRTTDYGELAVGSKTVQRRLCEVEQMGQEFNSLTPLLLHGSPIQMPRTSTPKTTPVRWRVLVLGGTPRMLIANPSGVGTTLRFRLPPGQWAGATAHHGGLTAKLRTISGSRFLEVEIPPHGSGDVSLNPPKSR